MKKLVVIALVAFLAVASVWAVSRDRYIQNIPKEGGNYNPLSKGGKGLVGFTAIGPMGYSDAWRTIAGMYGKSIVVDGTGQNLGVLYSQFSGNTSTPSNVKFAFSTDGGANWTHYDIVSNRNSRTYSGMAVTSDFTPVIIWQDRTSGSPWPILMTYDEMGFGGGMWASNIQVCNPEYFYLPGMAIANDRLICGAFPHGAFGGDFTLYMALANVNDIQSNGVSWIAPWDLSYPLGWSPWLDSPNDDQDMADFMISPAGQHIVAFMDEYYPTSGDLGGNGYAPCITWSTDGGVTWPNTGGTQPNTIKYYLYNDTLPPDGLGGGWWYRYDGLWLNNKPHLVYITEDLAWNGSYIVHSTPATPGDYTNWVHTVINPPEPTHRLGLGLSADWPTLSVDAAGNLYCTYVTWTATNIKDVWCVVSEDQGQTWHKPYLLTDATQDIGWVEAAETVADGKIHFIALNYALVDTLYYGTINTAEVLAAPMHDPNEPLTLLQYGRPVTDPVIDTIDSNNNPGDTLDFLWTWNTETFSGNYHIQISEDEAFTTPYTWAAGNIETNYFDRGINPYAPLNIGLPWNGMVYWRVRFDTPDKGRSPWSEVYRFVYNGTTLNTTDWVPEGVAGEPAARPVGKFALNQNRPNPVRGNAQISFSLPRAGDYCLRIYNVAGQTVKEFRGRGQAGLNTVNWNAKDAPNGVYFYNLTSGGQTATKKLVVVK